MSFNTTHTCEKLTKLIVDRTLMAKTIKELRDEHLGESKTITNGALDEFDFLDADDLDISSGIGGGGIKKKTKSGNKVKTNIEKVCDKVEGLLSICKTNKILVGAYKRLMTSILPNQEAKTPQEKLGDRVKMSAYGAFYMRASEIKDYDESPLDLDSPLEQAKLKLEEALALVKAALKNQRS